MPVRAQGEGGGRLCGADAGAAAIRLGATERAAARTGRAPLKSPARTTVAAPTLR